MLTSRRSQSGHRCSRVSGVPPQKTQARAISRQGRAQPPVPVPRAPSDGSSPSTASAIATRAGPGRGDGGLSSVTGEPGHASRAAVTCGRPSRCASASAIPAVVAPVGGGSAARPPSEARGGVAPDGRRRAPAASRDRATPLRSITRSYGDRPGLCLLGSAAASRPRRDGATVAQSREATGGGTAALIAPATWPTARRSTRGRSPCCAGSPMAAPRA
jgi:hypothetical protein